MIINIPHITPNERFLKLVSIENEFPEYLFEEFQAWHTSQELNPEYVEKFLYLKIGEEKLLVVKGWASRSMVAAQTLDGKRLFIGTDVDRSSDEAMCAREWVEVT